MPPLSPAQVNMVTVPLSFLSKIFKHFVGMKTANQRPHSETKIENKLIKITSFTFDSIMISKPINTKRTAFNISSIRCQKLVTCSLVDSLIASCKPVFPIKIPETTIAIGPEI